MTKTVKVGLILIAGIILLLVVLSNLVNSTAGKSWVEARASQKLRMETRIEGRVGISFFGGFYLTLTDVHISNRDRELVVAEQVKLEIALLPLITRQVEILAIETRQPVLSIVREIDGSFLFTTPEAHSAPFVALEIGELAITDASLSYTNLQTEGRFMAQGCDLQMHDMVLLESAGTNLLMNLDFMTELSCNAFSQNNFTGSDLTISAVAAAGVLDINPVMMRFLGGQGTGNIKADFSTGVPHYHVHYELPGFNLHELLFILPPEMSAHGTLDLSLDLALLGSSRTALTESSNGTVSLRGTNLSLVGIDLDEKFEQFESSQNFSLVDAGAFFLVGPLGLLATKAYDFSSLLQNSGSSSEIGILVSDWKIDNGVARAQDVALATQNNRIALQGELDLVNERFQDMTLGLIDDEGCAIVQQGISGSFAHAQAGGPGVITTLAGPVINLFKQSVALLDDEQCEVFYSGSVKVPG